MKGISALSNTVLAAFLIIGPCFRGSFLDAFSIPPVALKSIPIARGGVGFSQTPFVTDSTKSSRWKSLHKFKNNCRQTASASSSTNLFMYNLPPGGGGPKNDIADIAKSALSLGLFIAFLASPVGGFFLGLFNSFLFLLFVGPLVAFAGFQAWLSFNTIQAPCPNCGAPATVQKNKGGDSLVDSAPPPQSLCFSCGAVLEPNADNTGINNVTGRKTINDINRGQNTSIFDFFSNAGGAPTDPFSTTTTTTTVTEETVFTSSSSKKGGQQGIDKSSVIDVDVLDEDKPFQ